MFGRRARFAHAHDGDHQHPLLRQIGLAIPIAALLAILALLLLPPHAHGNFVYWANSDGNSIGRAKINGTGANNSFIPGLSNVHGVAVDSKYVYWTQGNGVTSTIGRANLDGTSPNASFIPSSSALSFATMYPQAGIAVTPSAIYWVNTTTGRIGRADISGANPNGSIDNPGPDPICGVAADKSFIYWMDTGLGSAIGRAGLDGSNPVTNFVPAVMGNCGVAVDSSFLYWGASGRALGRAPVTGGSGSADNSFLANAATTGNTACGIAVNPQYIFWGNAGSGASFVGRANINGGAPNPSLIPGPTPAGTPCLLMAAAPSNKITINSIIRKKKKGTATIDANVPGPGQVTLNQVSSPPDANATAAAVKQIGLTIGAASSFNLPVKPKGKTAKTLKKQVARKGKGKVKVKVFIHFVPAGVAGVPNTDPLTIKLIKRGKKH